MERNENGNNKKVICQICLKSFSTNKNLQNHHLTIHELVFPFKCSFANCIKSYTIESRLKLGEKPFKCYQCGKAFCERGNLKTHMKFHSPDKPFICNICHKAYKTKGHLKDHIEVQHNGYKKYKCSKCEKTFGRSSTLKAHFRTHTGEKNIKCRINTCNQFFAEKGNMEMHYKRHLIRLQKETGKVIEDSVNDIITNINITRPSSNITLVTEEDHLKKRMFIVNKNDNDELFKKNEKLELITPNDLINSNELIQFESQSSELNCDSFIFSFPNLSL